MSQSSVPRILWVLLAYFEAFVGWLLQRFRTRDAGLFTRGPQFKNVPEVVKVTSPLGACDLAQIPEENSEWGSHAFPDLLWGGCPAATKEILVVVQDPDAPPPFPICHSILYGIPASTHSLSAADLPNSGVTKAAGWNGPKTPVLAGKNIYGTVYQGPRPPAQHGPHRYFYQVIALSASIRDSFSSPPSLSQVAEATQGKIVGWGEWVGVYENTLKKALQRIDRADCKSE
ncbi:hypothetical protein WJX73_005244 [Symbiochloris irregularis]|uniref:PEBP-like protein n=1 Tax=Symbiochloris irregularis TaxID=706552 RepID=A0AAW1P4R6_9CHLO